jgi:hypothetical protein
MGANRIRYADHDSNRGLITVSKRWYVAKMTVFLLAYLAAASPFQVGAVSAQDHDVPIISNPKTPVPPPGSRKMLVFKEELSIGPIEGEEVDVFGPTNVTFNVDAEGTFYVTDYGKKRIRKFDHAGSYLGEIGRSGQGPGEFESPSDVQFDKSGRIFICDGPPNQKISFFDATGKYLSEAKLTEGLDVIRINATGNYLAKRVVNVQNEDESGSVIAWGIFDRDFKPLVIFGRREMLTKMPSAADLASLTDRESMTKFINKNVAAGISLGAFGPSPSMAVAEDDSILFGEGKDYVIDLFSPEGQKLRTIRRDYEPLKFTDKDKIYYESKTRLQLTNMKGGMFSEAQIKEILGLIEYPKSKPPYTDLVPMEKGWILVETELVPEEYACFDMFDEKGRFIGQFKSDFANQFFFKNGKAYAVVGKIGRQFVKRFSFEIKDY